MQGHLMNQQRSSFAGKDFLNRTGPAGYIPGIGRGATGFTSKAVTPASTAINPSAQMPLSMEQQQEEEPDSKDSNALGQGSLARNLENEVNLFNLTAPTTMEEYEADAIYAAVDAAMASRRKNQKAKQQNSQANSSKKLHQSESSPIESVSLLMADAKSELNSISYAEWAAIPEAGSDSLRRKRIKSSFVDPMKERYTPMIDASLQQLQGADSKSGIQTSSLRELGDAREKVLKAKLDQANAATGFSTSIQDPVGYLTGLATMGGGPGGIPDATGKSATEISKLKNLYKSLLATSPSHAPAWISAARLEESCGKLSAARSLIKKATTQASSSEDVWLEAARLCIGEERENILAEAITKLPNSSKIWIQAAEAQADPANRKVVLQKAIEINPISEDLWKNLIKYAIDENETRQYLKQAIAFVPESLSLWLALCKVAETHQESRNVLREARKALPDSIEIWLAACHLEEANAEDQSALLEMLSGIARRAINQILKVKKLTNRESFLRELAEKSEIEGFPLSAKTLSVAAVCLVEFPAEFKVFLEEPEKSFTPLSGENRDFAVLKNIKHSSQWKTWKISLIEEANDSLSRGCPIVCRTLLKFGRDLMPICKRLWFVSLEIEKRLNNNESIKRLLSEAVESNPESPLLLLLISKEYFKAKDYEQAAKVLSLAVEKFPEEEEVWLASAKVESERYSSSDSSKGIAAAREILARAKESGHFTGRLCMKSALLERDLAKDNARAKQILEEGLEKFPNYYKLWLMYAQLLEPSCSDTNVMISFYSRAVKECPDSAILWKLQSQMEESAGNVVRARALLEKAISLIGSNTNKNLDEETKQKELEILYVEAIRVEKRSGNISFAKNIIAKGISRYPKSGPLWAEAVDIEPLQTKKSKALDALKRNPKSPLILLNVAELFANAAGRDPEAIEKARDWFRKAAEADKDIGDIWIAWLSFENDKKVNNASESSHHHFDNVLATAVESEPHHGERWQKILKAPENRSKSTKDLLLSRSQTMSSANNAALSALAYARIWHHVDAKDLVPGRLATRIAIALMGKHKPIYHPTIDCGDVVVVTNCAKLRWTGKKLDQKVYYSHSGYPGGLKITKLSELMKESPKITLQSGKYYQKQQELENEVREDLDGVEQALLGPCSYTTMQRAALIEFARAGRDGPKKHDPGRPLRLAVSGMLPKHDGFRSARMARLFTFPNEWHPYGQNIYTSTMIDQEKLSKIPKYGKDARDALRTPPMKVLIGLEAKEFHRYNI